MLRITDAEVYEKWNVKAATLGDLLALAGDSSDNIPGVMGKLPKYEESHFLLLFCLLLLVRHRAQNCCKSFE